MARALTPRDTPEYRRNAAALRAEERPCWLCGLPIDYGLPNPDPRSFSADHIIELDRGGTNDPHNLAATHLSCNSRRGAIYRNTGRTTGQQWRPERAW